MYWSLVPIQAGVMQWAGVITVESLAETQLDLSQLGRKIAGRGITVQLHTDQLLVQQHIGQGAFASVYKVRPMQVVTHFRATSQMMCKSLQHSGLHCNSQTMPMTLAIGCVVQQWHPAHESAETAGCRLKFRGQFTIPC